MNIPNPKQVASNRTARLVREAHTPVYSTQTATLEVDRPHTKMVEMEFDSGYRTWSSAMPESAVNGYIESFMGVAMLSDIDCSFTCWCQS